jgi:transcriptional regulator with XRE-family HTH domain
MVIAAFRRLRLMLRTIRKRQVRLVDKDNPLAIYCQAAIVEIDMNNHPAPDPFPSRLRAARDLRALSQADLAERAGLPATSISHFEAGSRKPSFDNLRRLADTLEVTADYLLGRVDEPSGQSQGTLHRHVENLTAGNRALAEDFLKMLADRERKRDQ